MGKTHNILLNINIDDDNDLEDGDPDIFIGQT